MPNLKTNADLCRTCPSGACLVRCQYLDYEPAPAREEMLKIHAGQDSPVLEACVTCYACEEYCPRGNHPFYLISDRREAKGILTAPRAITRQWVHIGEPRGKFEHGTIGKRLLSCGFMPQLKALTGGELFADIMPSFVFGQEYFCNVVYIHFAKPSIILARLPEVIANYARLGVEEIVFLHDECYAAFASLAPAYGLEVPFRSVHYFEYLYGRLLELKDRIRPLGLKAAYQRPCSSRFIPSTHAYVARIMDLIGVELVPRTYQDEAALCCGSIFRAMYGYDLAADVQQRNLADIKASGAQICVFNCHGCQGALADKVACHDIRPLHMIELCRLAIGEDPATGA